MADAQATSTAKQILNIPEETGKKFPEYVELIKHSQTMNDEERQYWVDVLPIMSDDQLKNLRSILDNEKKQIEEANKNYDEGVKEDVKKFNIKFDEIKYKQKKDFIRQQEKSEEMQEKKDEEAVLAELANL